MKVTLTLDDTQALTDEVLRAIREAVKREFDAELQARIENLVDFYFRPKNQFRLAVIIDEYIENRLKATFDGDTEPSLQHILRDVMSKVALEQFRALTQNP